MLNYVNQHERCHIVTIEDPIEFTFTDDKCIINQREVGIDVIDWDTALKHAVRQDPDIILVGEMRDRDTFGAALHAAETGHLVFGTIHASSPVDDQPDPRPLPARHARGDAAEPGVQPQGIIAQKLLPTTKEWAEKHGPDAASRSCEIMRMNPTVRKLILNEEDNKLGEAIRLGKEEGMVDFTESLRQLVVAEKVERATAFEVRAQPRDVCGWRSRASTLPERRHPLTESRRTAPAADETTARLFQERHAMTRPRLALSATLALGLIALAASPASAADAPRDSRPVPVHEYAPRAGLLPQPAQVPARCS